MRIFTPEHVESYSLARLQAKGASLEDLARTNKYILDVGLREQEFLEKRKEAAPVEQEFPREPLRIDFERQTQYIPVWDGLSRLDRYLNMLENLKRLPKYSQISWETHPFKLPWETTCDRIQKTFPNEVVADILSHNKKFTTVYIGPLRNVVDALYVPQIFKTIKVDDKDYRDELQTTAKKLMHQDQKSSVCLLRTDNYLSNPGVQHIAMSNIMHSIKYHEDFAKARDKSVQRFRNFYVDYQFFKHNNETKLAVNYMYGDQMYNFLKPFIETHLNKNHSLNVVRHGKMGSLTASARRGDGVLTEGVLRENTEGQLQMTNSENLLRQRLGLARNSMILFSDYGIKLHCGLRNYNTRLVLDQTTEEMKKAVENGASVVEMEEYYALRAIADFKMRFPHKNINYIGLGYISDAPLSQDTLAHELLDYRGIYKLLQMANTFF
ncbi:MAG: hypothetical protein ABIF10_06840 [Candidatus Woesearchaeota archaeon]